MENNNPYNPQPQPQPQPQPYAQAPQQPRPQQYAQAPQQPNPYAQPQQYAQAPQPGAQQQYAPNGQPIYINIQNQRPTMQLDTNRSLLKYILLSIVTCGIYGIIAMYKATEDLNTIASKYDGKKTMNFLLMALLLTPVTCGIYAIVWYHTYSERIGAELQRRGIQYSFGSSTFWLWNVLGSLIIVGPFIYLHKMFEALNLLSESYNVNG